MKKVKLTLSILLTYSCQSLMAQEKTLQVQQQQQDTQRISIATEIVQDLMSEFNITAEYKLNRHIALGISPAVIIMNQALAVNPLSGSQDEYPGKVYNGYAIRVFAKRYINKKSRSYFELALIYKSLHYDSVGFTDIVRHYERNEKAYVFGVDIIYGFELSRGKKAAFFADPYLGLGFRGRDRHYTTYNSYLSGNASYPPPLPTGSFHTEMGTIVLVAGFKIDGNMYINKHS
jgi:hypothetical protein